MLLTCPSCGARHAIEAATNDEAAREVVSLVASMGSAGIPAIHYLALFRPRLRALRWIRALALMRELSAAVHAGAVERNGRAHPIRPEAWVLALESVIAAGDGGRLRLPLKSHGYLWEVVTGLSERLAGEEERARDEALRGRPRPGSAPAAEPARLDPEVARRHLEAGWAALGRSRPGDPS